MERITYLAAYPLLWALSRLPFGVFYKVSDGVFWVVYHVARYRRKTVQRNLELVFPEKSHKQRAEIEKDFYRHMVDMFLEMIKSLHMSDRELDQRFKFTNLEELLKIGQSGKSVILACGHYASYEWINALQLHQHPFSSFGVYKKIKNPYFDKLVRRIREQYRTQIISSTEVIRIVARNQRSGLQGIYAMVADQSPKLKGANFWTQFMGIRVPVFMGTESLARKYDMAVVYLNVEKVKRGHYQATFKTITTQPDKEPPHDITRRYFDLLEDQIRKDPPYYLWTHKRWKHHKAPMPERAITF